MCDFVSWIEYKDTLYYLTKECLRDKRATYIDMADISGHGAIEIFYDLQNRGIHKECTDFSSPKNFPQEIADAIKNVKFRGIGLDVRLLNQQGCAKYYNIEQPAYDKYEKIRQAAYDKYEITGDPLFDEYDIVVKPAYDTWVKIRQKAFWDIFAIKKYRAKAWR